MSDWKLSRSEALAEVHSLVRKWLKCPDVARHCSVTYSPKVRGYHVWYQFEDGHSERIGEIMERGSWIYDPHVLLHPYEPMYRSAKTKRLVKKSTQSNRA
jgi:hypothetical protein